MLQITTGIRVKSKTQTHFQRTSRITNATIAVCEALEERRLLSANQAESWLYQVFGPEMPAQNAALNQNKKKPTVGRVHLPKAGTAAAGNGLTAEYFKNATLSGTPVTRVDKTVNFNWNKAAPAPTVPGGKFSVQWTGQIVAPKTGTYIFSSIAKGATVLTIGGVQVFNSTGVNPAKETTASGNVALVAGQAVTLELDYYSGPRSMISFKWAGPKVPKQVIPAKSLLSETPAPTAPQSFTALVISATEIDLAWQESDSSITGFAIQRSTDGVNFSTVANLGADATSYTDTGLTPSTSYTYRVVVINALGTTAYSPLIVAKTADVAVIAIPIDMLSATSNSATISWSSPSSSITGFDVDRSDDGGMTWNTLANVGPNVFGYTDSTVVDGRSYAYRIRGSSDSLDNTYLGSGSLAVPLAAPTTLVAARQSGSVQLTWTNNSQTATGTVIQRSTDGGSTWTTLTTLGAVAASYSDIAVVDGNTYEYRINAIVGQLASTFAGPATAIIPLAPPTVLSDTFSSTSVHLTWADTSAAATGYQIQRSTDGGSTWANLVTLNASATAYTDNTVVDGETFTYRISATLGQLTSAFAGPVVATIPLAPPTNLSDTANSTSAALTWSDNSATATGYQVQRSVDSGLWITLITLGAGATAYTDNTLSRASVNDYRVIAIATGISSQPSNVVIVPSAIVPNSPSNLAATAVSDTEVNLTWDRNGTGETSITIWRSTGGGAYQQLTSLPAGSNIFTDTSCYPTTTYSYEVTADNVNGRSNPSTASATTTEASLATDPAATNLTATAVSPFEVDLNWTDNNSGGNENWLVERSENGASYSIIADVVITGGGPGGTVTCTDAPLSPATTYTYRVRVETGSSYSDYTAPVSATTVARSAGTPVEATGLTVTVNSATNTTLNWTDTNNGTASYLVETAAYSWENTPAWTQIAQTAVGATSYSLTTTPETFYYVRIRAANGTGDSGYTPQVIVRSASAGTGSPQVYTIGPGKEYASLGALNWSQLGPGDTVEIYPNKDGSGNIIPYYEKPLISERGTAAAPITIEGMPDPTTGQLPIIDGTNAVTSAQWAVSYIPLEDLSLILIGNRPAQPTGWSPGYFNLQNLDIRNGYSGDPGNAVNTYTASDGTTRSYSSGAVCGIYLEEGDHISIKGCAIHANNEGIFGAGQGDFRNLESLTIDSDQIYGNGTINSSQTHNSYIEGINVIYQYDDYGPLRASSEGAGLKDRGAGTIVRYCSFQGGGHLLDLVEAQNYASVTLTLASYQSVDVYGNFFYNTSVGTGGATTPIYYGADTLPTPSARKGVLEFYNNTFIEQADQAQQYDMELFDLPTGAGAVDSRNNIFYNESATPGANPPELDLLSKVGSAYFGVNWITQGWQDTFTGYMFNGVAAGTQNFITNAQNDPGFVDAATHNYQLTGSAQAIGQGQALPINDPPVLFQYTPPGGTPRDDSGADLGAFEHQHVGMAYTSTQSGLWSQASTWGGAGVPGPGDTVTINDPVTVDVNTIIGDSPTSGGPVVLTINAQLTVAAGVTLSVRGPVTQGNAAAIFEAGSILQFDASQSASPMSTDYAWTSNAWTRGNRMITLSGISNSHVTIESNASGGNGFFFSADGYSDSLWINASYADFKSIGSSVNSALRLNPSTDPTINVLDHCTFDTDCGAVEFDNTPPPTGGWDIEDCDFLQVAPKAGGTGNPEPLVLRSTQGTTSGTRRLYRCVFMQYPRLTGSDLDVQDCYFNTGWDDGGGSEKWAQMVGSFIRLTTNQGQNNDGDVSDSFVLFDAGETSSDSGSVASASSMALSDPQKAWNTNLWIGDTNYCYMVEITDGTGVGQRRLITGNSATQLQIAYRWDVTPDSTSTYAILKDIYNNHGLIPSTAITAGTVSYNDNVFQSAGTDTQGDCILHMDNGPAVSYSITNNLVLPNAMGDSSGTLLTIFGNSNIHPQGDIGPYTIEHNTYFVGAQALSISEGGTNPAGIIPTFNSNIAWADPSRTYFTHGGTAGPYAVNDTDHTNNVQSNTADVMTPSGITNNCCYGVQSGAAGKGFNVNLSTSPNNTNLYQINPNFVDPTRSFWSWAVSRGSAANTISGQISDGLAYLQADPTLTRTSLIPYMQGGFAPTNSALHGTASDGGDIGAVPYVP